MGRADNEVFNVVEPETGKAVIRVIGVGGGGCNTVNQMVKSGIEGVDFICANTDRQHLERCGTTSILPMGNKITRGLGAGSKPEVGRQAALEDRERIAEMIDGTDLLFITAGMGGGTGTGAAPVIAEIAKELGILTVAVVTKPFLFEQKRRMQAALIGIEEMEKHVDSLIMIPNEKLVVVLGEDATMEACFKAANDVLQNAVRGISDLITQTGMVNVDFADVRTVMLNRGKAMMGSGQASGADRAMQAVEAALACPLLDDLELTNAAGLLVNIACDNSLKMSEVSKINNRVNEIASQDVDVKFGTSTDQSLNGELRVTVVATGLGRKDNKVVPIETAKPMPPKVGDKMGWGRISDVPSHIRNGGQQHGQPSLLQNLVDDENILNVPAFLRAQAD